MTTIFNMDIIVLSFDNGSKNVGVVSSFPLLESFNNYSGFVCPRSIMVIFSGYTHLLRIAFFPTNNSTSSQVWLEIRDSILFSMAISR